MPTPFCARACLIITLLLMASPIISHADSQLYYTSTADNMPEHKMMIAIHGKQVRISDNGNKSYTLFDANKPALVYVIPQTQRYFTTNLDNIAERTQKLLFIQRKFRQRLETEISQLHEPERTQAKKRLHEAEMMTTMRLPKPDYHHTKQTITVNGLDCDITLVQIGEIPIREICHSTQAALNEQDFAQFMNMLRFTDQLSMEVMRIQARPSAPEGAASIQENGLALRIRTLPVGIITELEMIKHEALDDDFFAIPANYVLEEPNPDLLKED